MRFDVRERRRVHDAAKQDGVLGKPRAPNVFGGKAGKLLSEAMDMIRRRRSHVNDDVGNVRRVCSLRRRFWGQGDAHDVVVVFPRSVVGVIVLSVVDPHG